MNPFTDTRHVTYNIKPLKTPWIVLIAPHINKVVLSDKITRRELHCSLFEIIRTSQQVS